MLEKICPIQWLMNIFDYSTLEDVIVKTVLNREIDMQSNQPIPLHTISHLNHFMGCFLLTFTRINKTQFL